MISPGIHAPSGPRTDRSDLVRDFQIFLGPGHVRDFQNSDSLIPDQLENGDAKEKRQAFRELSKYKQLEEILKIFKIDPHLEPYVVQLMRSFLSQLKDPGIFGPGIYS